LSSSPGESGASLEELENFLPEAPDSLGDLGDLSKESGASPGESANSGRELSSSPRELPNSPGDLVNSLPKLANSGRELTNFFFRPSQESFLSPCFSLMKTGSEGQVVSAHPEQCCCFEWAEARMGTARGNAIELAR